MIRKMIGYVPVLSTKLPYIFISIDTTFNLITNLWELDGRRMGDIQVFLEFQKDNSFSRISLGLLKEFIKENDMISLNVEDILKVKGLHLDKELTEKIFKYLSNTLDSFVLYVEEGFLGKIRIQINGTLVEKNFPQGELQQFLLIKQTEN